MTPSACASSRTAREHLGALDAGDLDAEVRAVGEPQRALRGSDRLGGDPVPGEDLGSGQPSSCILHEHEPAGAGCRGSPSSAGQPGSCR